VTRVIGLTGGIGTGKSTVARMLAELGAVVIDADAIVHELQAPGSPALARSPRPRLRRLDAAGALDRARVAERVFATPRCVSASTRSCTARRRRDGTAYRRGASRRAPLVVLDIPLLFETHPRDRDAAAAGSDATVLVYAPPSLQIDRTVARNGCTREEAERRVARSCRSTRSARSRTT